MTGIITGTVPININPLTQSPLIKENKKIFTHIILIKKYKLMSALTSVTVSVLFLICLSASSVFSQSLPKITKLFPDTASPGEMIIIIGEGFTSEAGKIIVYFGDKPVKAAVASDKSIAVDVPKDIRDCEVLVEINGIKSNSVTFKLGTAENTKSLEQKIKISLTVTDPVADVGKIITGTFKATGTENPVKINFKNQSPEVVSIEGGNEQTIVTSGGSENIYNFKIKALSGPKKYTISYSWQIHKLEIETKENIWEKINLIQKPSMKQKKSSGG